MEDHMGGTRSRCDSARQRTVVGRRAICAILGFVVVISVMGSVAAPADAVAMGRPTSSTQPGDVTTEDTLGTVPTKNATGGSNLAMSAAVAAFVCAVGSLCAGRPHLARARAVRRFRIELRAVDVVSRCLSLDAGSGEILG